VENPAAMCSYHLELSAELKCRVEANLLSLSLPVIMCRYTNLYLSVIDKGRIEDAQKRGTWKDRQPDMNLNN
jgi:hypothetical protein